MIGGSGINQLGSAPVTFAMSSGAITVAGSVVGAALSLNTSDQIVIGQSTVQFFVGTGLLTFSGGTAGGHG
jgi:hypothetical protein